MQNVYEKFEFNRIKAEVASFSRTEVAKEKINNLSMFANSIEMREELEKLDEMIILLFKYGCLPIQVSASLEKCIRFAQKGGVLDVEEMERVANDVLEQKSIRNYFRQVTDSPILSAYITNFPDIEYIERAIHKIIAPDLSIFDNASPKLKSIRVSIARCESEMKKKLGFILGDNKDFLTAETLTMKNGHYVIPVANAYKHRVKGIVQDISNSGETTFIEPDVLVELNNKMAELKNEERAEIRRLLAELSAAVASAGDNLIRNNHMIGYLDFLQSKALYAEKIDGRVAIFSETPRVEIYNARHPLLDPKKVVANDFVLGEKNSMVIISGPNAGGKTVALKTLGILVMMNQCGLAIPATQGATLSYFKHIFVDIGDSQSLSDNLSTFSGHMKNISEIMDIVGGKDLVLLDEVGTGTSPKEGEAIAYAIINHLLRKHAVTMISSHFEGLKAYALSCDDVMNASMIFDEENLLPTYKLKMGLPGESYGLIVARRFGLSEEILKSAQSYLSEHEETSVTDAIKKLTEVTRKTEEERNEVARMKAEMDRREGQMKAKESALAMREEKFMSDVDMKKKAILREYEDELNKILKSVQSGEAKMHEVISAKKKVKDLEVTKEEQKFTGPVNVGDYVNIPSLFAAGKVKSINGNKVEVISKEGISFKVAIDKCIKVPEPEVKKKAVNGYGVDSVGFGPSVSMELNLIGQHVEEAKLNLMNYLDKCILKRYKRVRIIHGWGSGALRNLVRGYLEEHKKDFVKSYEGATGEEGGGGATICYLK
ncbi:MAG: endonuclease MutS2 [Bacilli bacterium]|nr:endonuclease MutS2 [Bacilli bacterium]